MDPIMRRAIGWRGESLVGDLAEVRKGDADVTSARAVKAGDAGD